jgi:hypothetical protein
VGFFAVPYTVMVYPLMFAVFPRLWEVSRANGYVTAADFVRGRFGSGALALAVAVTGIVATMPYIALQLIGIEVVLEGLGVHGEWPLAIAFMVLAVYTYTSGLRAPAMIAVVKDVLIYVTIIVAVIVIPEQLGGYGKLFASIPPPKLLLAAASAHSLGPQAAYATLALGSALALLLYPHAMTGVLSSSSREVIRRNAVALPVYSAALGLIALLGIMALAASVQEMPQYAAGFKAFGANYAVPALFLHAFPLWFVGVAFAAIAIGALVPAAIMSIACANLFTRNIYREYCKPGCTSSEESRVAGREIRCPCFRHRAACAVRDRTAAAGRYSDHTDSAADSDRTLHPLAASVCAIRRLALRDRKRGEHVGEPRIYQDDVQPGPVRYNHSGICGTSFAAVEHWVVHSAHAAFATFDSQNCTTTGRHQVNPLTTLCDGTLLQSTVSSAFV